MRHFKSLLFTFILIITTLLSCKKDDDNSILSGKITYVGAISGIEYVADGAEVYLHLGSPGETSGQHMNTVTGSDGGYRFKELWQAHWYIYARVTVNGITYTGSTGTTSVNGSNDVTLNLKMN